MIGIERKAGGPNLPQPFAHKMQPTGMVRVSRHGKWIGSFPLQHIEGENARLARRALNGSLVAPGEQAKTF